MNNLICISAYSDLTHKDVRFDYIDIPTELVLGSFLTNCKVIICMSVRAGGEDRISFYFGYHTSSIIKVAENIRSQL